jgi:alpha-tubulin suppressor-like RCC1 family protein
VKKSGAWIVSLIALSWLATACKEEQLSGPGFICDVTNPVRDLTIDPPSSVLLVRSPARPADVLQLKAVATNRLDQPRTDVPISFSSSDVTVATVDSLGLVHALKPGSVTIKASTCGKTATSRITVVGAVVTVQVATTATNAVAGDTIVATARAIGQNGQQLSDVKFSFSASPAGLASVKATSDSTAIVTTLAPGTATITAVGESATGSAAIVILPKAFLSAATSAGGIDAGAGYTCGLITLGRGYCWGSNSQAQLASRSDSVCFGELLPGQDSLQATAQPCSLLPLRVSQTLSFTSVSAGDSTACGLASTGSVYCWGYNADGEIGNGSTGNRSTPTLVTSALTFTSLTAGGSHTCALAAGGAAYCWGQDSLGQLGDARRAKSTTPIPVSGGGGPAIFASISAGKNHTCALFTSGTAFCWGNNDSGQVGNGTFSISETPAPVSQPVAFTSISAGRDHTCALAANGAAYCWGSNFLGQLGNPNVGTSPTPVQVVGGQTFVAISSGGAHTCALTGAGAVFCWGSNADLQLGRGPFTGGDVPGTTPVQVGQGERPAGVTFTSVSAGATHTCGVGSDGAAYCWGSNIRGALGNTLQAAFRGFPQRVATPQ